MSPKTFHIPKLPPAEILRLEHMHYRAAKGFRLIATFKSFGIAGIQANVPEYPRRRPWLDGVTKNTLTPEATMSGMPFTPLEWAAYDSEAVIGGFSLVFAHALLEQLVADLIELSATLEPSLWWEQIRDKKTTLADVRSKGVDEVIADQLSAFLKGLQGAPLPKRIKSLLATFAVGEPLSHPELRGFRFEVERVRAIDARRHEIVHALNFTSDGVDEDVDYFAQVCFFLLLHFSQRFGIETSFSRDLERPVP